MKKILLLIILLPALCQAQKDKGYGQIAFNYNLSKKLGDGVGGSFMAGTKVGSQSSIGAGIDVIKFGNLSKVASFLYGDLRFFFGKGFKHPLPYLTITPGYFMYNDTRVISRSKIGYSGGFLFGAGLGCILYSGHKVAPFISAIYDNFPIEITAGNKSTEVKYDVAKLTIGIKF